MIGLAQSMFGKKEKDLTLEELRQVWVARKKLYITKKPEKHREFQKRYYAKHKEQIKTRNKEKQREEACSYYKIYKLALEKACKRIAKLDDCVTWCEEVATEESWSLFSEEILLPKLVKHFLEQAKAEIEKKDD